MTPTEELKHEHEIVQHALRILGKLSDRVDAGDTPNTDHLALLLDFLAEFVDKCHHFKEEDQLFPLMQRASGEQVKPMIMQMLTEHESGRMFVKGMKQAFDDYTAGETQALSALIEQARGYITLLNDHIVKEDTILYAAADQSLTQAQQTALEAGFEEIEERTGAGKHEEYHELIHRLEQVYQ